MIKIVVGGQINKQEIRDFIENNFGKDNVVVEVKTDLDAAMAVQNGLFDYYVGACQTGSGGALAMAIALLGFDKCKTIATPGGIIAKEEIISAVNDNCKAFGFTGEHIASVLPVLLDALRSK